jgi:prepilin-type N-terminal cleavage/methylation domain-containing protein
VYLGLSVKSRKQGFSLVEVLVASAILSVCALTASSVINMSRKNSSQLRVTRAVVNARSQIEAALKNSASWALTMASNPELQCGRHLPNGCAMGSNPDQSYNFILYDSLGTKLSYDPKDPTTRIGVGGGACAKDMPENDLQCPARYQATWKPLCPSAPMPCLNPSVEIKVNLITEMSQINVNNYQYQIIRSIDDDTLKMACLAANGSYNAVEQTCYPKYAGRSCASIGKPHQIVSAVHSDGSIECSPYFHGLCTAGVQVVKALDSNGKALCGLKVPGVRCPIDCVGHWGACSKPCGGGSRKYIVDIPANSGGSACPFKEGATGDCNTGICPVNCVGAWSECSVACGGGESIYHITTLPNETGAACAHKESETIRCNTQACSVDQDCVVSWNTCDPQTGRQDYVVVQNQQGAGVACPEKPRICDVNCQGHWGVCEAGVRTYIQTIAKKNAGVECPYPDGATDIKSCRLIGECLPAVGAQIPYAPKDQTACASGHLNGINGGTLGPWSWICVGLNHTASCSATKIPASYSQTMTCGSSCSGTAWTATKNWIYETLAPAGVTVNPQALETSAMASLLPIWYACEKDRYYRGPYAASVSNGNVQCLVSVKPTEDEFKLPDALLRACVITFSVKYW